MRQTHSPSPSVTTIRATRGRVERTSHGLPSSGKIPIGSRSQQSESQNGLTMHGTLTSTQREYVLFHLRQHIELNGISRYLAFSSEDQDVDHLTGHIIFKCTSAPFRHDGIKFVDGIPVLFPLDDTPRFYYKDANDNLVFPHDILKSAFYLLSGYQEYENGTSKDQLGRFSFEDAVQ